MKYPINVWLLGDGRRHDAVVEAKSEDAARVKMEKQSGISGWCFKKKEVKCK